MKPTAVASSPVIRLVDVPPPNQAIIRLRRRRHGRQVELRKVRQQVVRHRLLVLLLLQSELEALGADNKYVFSVDQYGHQRKSGSH